MGSYFHCHEKLSFRGDTRRMKENNGVSTTQPGCLASFTQRTDDFTCYPVLLMPPANNSDLFIALRRSAFAAGLEIERSQLRREA